MASRSADGTLTDPRLEETWRSDAARTIAEWRERRPMTDEQAAALGQLFGHLRVTFSGRYVTDDYSSSPLPGTASPTGGGWYTVVGRDRTSVVILAPQMNSGELALAHLRFCGDNTYWVHDELAPLREYFVREVGDQN